MTAPSMPRYKVEKISNEDPEVATGKFSTSLENPPAGFELHSWQFNESRYCNTFVILWKRIGIRGMAY